MPLINSIRKRVNNFCFNRLIDSVRNQVFRPFSIDEQGIWFKTKYGFSVYSNRRDRILELDVNAEWEPMESLFISNNVKQGDVFIDVGANIGYFSMMAASQKASRVLSVEPIPKTYNMLNMNITHNKFTDIVKTFNIGLGDKNHTAKFTSTLGPKNHLEYEVDNVHSDVPTVELQITTLDSLIDNQKDISKIDFIKVDIEGYEYFFLSGAQKTIEKFRPTILMEVEEHRLVKFGITAEKIFNFMSRMGYKHLLVTDDLIKQGSDYKEDLKKGRDFVFYTEKNYPKY